MFSYTDNIKSSDTTPFEMKIPYKKADFINGRKGIGLRILIIETTLKF